MFVRLFCVKDVLFQSVGCFLMYCMHGKKLIIS